MDLSNIKPARGAVKAAKKRLGRGQGTGRGGTSTRGHKGAKSRSGYSTKIGFEGGQMPLQRRIPKFGFKNVNRTVFRGINLDTIQQLAKSNKVGEVNKIFLINHGMAGRNDLIKILGRGELTVKVDVTANAFSASARTAIEKAGGKALVETILPAGNHPPVKPGRNNVKGGNATKAKPVKAQSGKTPETKKAELAEKAE